MKKIAIFGTPRSGTSWLAQIFNSHPDVVLRFQPLFSYGHKGRLTEYSSKTQIDKFFDEIFYSTDPFTLMQTESQKNYPSFAKSHANSHLVFKETRYLNVMSNLIKKSEDVSIIAIIRDPLSVLSSWMGARNEFCTDWNIHKEWRHAPRKNRGQPEEFFGFEKWKQFAYMCLVIRDSYPKRFKLIRYDELKAKTLRVTASLFDFSALRMDPQVIKFIHETSERHDEDPYSVFRAKANSHLWKSHLPVAIYEEIFEELMSTPLEQFLPNSALSLS